MSSTELESKTYARGVFWGAISFSIWGFFPLFWNLLSSRSPFEILAHRMVWAFIFYLLLFLIMEKGRVGVLFRQTKKDWLLSGIASIVLSLNWLIYIFAVTRGHILEASLAYFINPLFNVAVGVLFFKESFPLALKLAVGFAFFGVLAKMIYANQFLWISLAIAISFCAYGVTKKLLKIPVLTSSVLEGVFGVIPGAIAIYYFQSTNTVAASPEIWTWFILGGAVTGLPLFLFSFAAQRIPYSVVGMLQFINPTIQFAVGVFIFGETFGLSEKISFGLIWVGLAFYLSQQILKIKPSSNLTQ